jgi:hypothetical protein
MTIVVIDCYTVEVLISIEEVVVEEILGVGVGVSVSVGV